MFQFSTLPLTVSLTQGAVLLAQFQAISISINNAVRRRTQVGTSSNRNIIVGNLGAVSTGTQDASPVNT